jgi:hypothetical protein
MIQNQKERRGKMELKGEQIGGNKPWVAKIIGTDPKWGLKREFCQGIKDYSGSNSVGTRGIKTVWLISEPGIYEYNLPQSWKSTDRNFVEILADGTDQSIDKIEIAKRFQNPKKEVAENGKTMGIEAIV